jgi:hypothetical protein
MPSREIIELLKERNYTLVGGAFRTQRGVSGTLIAHLQYKDLTISIPFPKSWTHLADEVLAERLADLADRASADKFHKDQGDMA